jgi:hypothetical protein
MDRGHPDTGHNGRVSIVFGEVAGLYDRARRDYLPEIADVVLDYAGATPVSAAEVGAGTGKGPALFAGRGFPITCVEPDTRMSEVLLARFPEVTVVTAKFGDWTPPEGGVDLLFAATAWHWVDTGTRAPLAARALAHSGTLALIGRRTQHRDRQVDRQIREAYRQFGPDSGDRAPLPEWALPELRDVPLLTDLNTWEATEDVDLPMEQYLDCPSRA